MTPPPPPTPPLGSLSGVDFQRWLTGCGAPPHRPDLSAGAALIRPVRQACRAWGGGDGRADDTREAAALLEVAGWSTFQVVLFLDCMLDRAPLPHGKLGYVGVHEVSMPHFEQSLCCRGDVATAHALRLAVGRPERGSPSALAAAGGPQSLLPRAAQTRRLPPKTRQCADNAAAAAARASPLWLTSAVSAQTSRMYTVPLYEDLSAGAMRGVAADAFRQTRRRLHPNLRRTLQQIMARGQHDAAADAAPPPQPPDAAAVVPLRDVDVSA